MRISQTRDCLTIRDIPGAVWLLGLGFVASGAFVLSIPLWFAEWRGFVLWERAAVLVIGLGHLLGGAYSVLRPASTRTDFDRSSNVGLQLVRRLWPKVLRWWEDAKDGGAILGNLRKYMLLVFTPSLLGWIASLGVMAVFLAAYDIPVSFHTLMRIAGGNSIANVTSATPGGAGVNQAFNVASLKGIATTEQATAYSVAQQLVTTAWNIIFGIILVVWAFGWSGGKQLVGESYEGAKAKTAEQRAARAERKAAKREAKAAEQG